MLRFLRAATLAAIVLTTPGCVLLAVNAVSSETGVADHPAQRYGALERQGLDVYTPRQAAAQPRSVVVFFYGGGWQTGSKSEYRFAGEALAAQGFVAVVPDYRIYPEVKFPVFLEDGAAAVRWVHDHIAEFGGDPQRVFLMGHSAGAHIAAMLALDPRYLAAQGLTPSDLRGFIGVAGPYEFLPLKSPRMIAIFGGANGIPETQPITFVSSAAPPALLLHGTDDTRVRLRNSERLAQRIRETGGSVTEVVYAGVTHSGILLALSPAFERIAPVRQDTAAFVRSH